MLPQFYFWQPQEASFSPFSRAKPECFTNFAQKLSKDFAIGFGRKSIVID